MTLDASTAVPTSRLGIKIKRILQTEILPGPAVDEICAAAGDPEIDLVVISTHGRTGLKHALIGSVAEHVVRYAERPVLVVPSRHVES